MNATEPNNVVLQLIEDLAAGQKVVIPGFDLLQAQAMKSLTDKLAEYAREDSSEEGLRQFAKAQLGLENADAIHVVTSGFHEFHSGFIIAAGVANVTLCGHGVLLAIGHAKVVARGRATVFGTDNSHMKLYDNTVANLSGSVKVNSYDHSTGVAEGSVRGIARHRSAWKLLGSADFDAFDNVVAYGREGCSIRAYGSSKLIGRERVRAQLFDGANGWFTDQSEVELYGSSIVYAEPSARAHIIGSSARLLPLNCLALAWSV